MKRLFLLPVLLALGGCPGGDIDPAVQFHNDCMKTGKTSEQCTQVQQIDFCKSNPGVCEKYCKEFPTEKSCLK